MSLIIVAHEFGNNLDFDFEFQEIDDEHIELIYTVKNTQNTDIYLLTPLFDPINCTFQPDDQQLYSFWHSAYVLHFTKRLWPAAKELKIGVKHTPFLKKLSQGEDFKEIIKIRTPHNIRYPYYHQEKNDMMDLGYNTDRYVCMSRYATFSLGYVVADEIAFEQDFIRPVYKEDLDFKPLMMEEYFDNFDNIKMDIEESLLVSAQPTIPQKHTHKNIHPSQKTKIDKLFEADFKWLAEKQKILRAVPQKLMVIAIQE